MEKGVKNNVNHIVKKRLYVSQCPSDVCSSTKSKYHNLPVVFFSKSNGSEPVASPGEGEEETGSGAAAEEGSICWASWGQCRHLSLWSTGFCKSQSDLL